MRASIIMRTQESSFFIRNFLTVSDTETKIETDEETKYSPDSIVADLMSFQSPLISVFSDKLFSPALHTIRQAARLLDWLQWYPTGTEAQIRYYIGTGRWDRLTHYDRLAVQALFDLIINEENWSESDLFSALANFNSQTVLSVLQQTLATSKGAAGIIRAFAHISDFRLYLPLLQLLVIKDAKNHEESIRAIVRSDISWVPWLVMHLCSEEYTMIQTVSHLLDELGWYPTGQDYRIRYYIGTDRWDNLVQTGSPGCKSFLPISGCREEKRLCHYISTLRKFSLQEVIHALSSLSEKDLNTAIHTLTAVTEPDDLSYVLTLFSDEDLPSHQFLIARLEPVRFLLISFIESSLSLINPDFLPAATNLLRYLMWYPTGEKKILYWAGQKKWKEMLDYLPAARELVNPSVTEWIASSLPHTGLMDLFSLASVLTYTQWHPIGYFNQLAYAIGRYDWKQVSSYGPPAIKPLIYLIHDAKGSVCTEMIKVITQSGSVALASVCSTLICDEENILSFIRALIDNVDFLRRESSVTDTLLSAFLYVITPQESSNSLPELSKPVRSSLISLLTKLMPALSYHSLINACTLLDTLKWYPTGEELHILYYIGKKEWDAIGRYGPAGVASLLLYVDNIAVSDDFPYQKALSRCMVPDIIQTFFRFRTYNKRPDIIQTFMHQLMQVIDPTYRTFFISLLVAGDEESTKISDLLTDTEKDILASWILDQMKSVTYPELCSLCLILTRLNRMPLGEENRILYQIGMNNGSKVTSFGLPAIMHLFRLITITQPDQTSNLFMMLRSFPDYLVCFALARMVSDEKTGSDLMQSLTHISDPGTIRFLVDCFYNENDLQELESALIQNRAQVVPWLSLQLLSHDETLISRSAALLRRLAWYPVGDEKRFIYFVVTHDWNNLIRFPLSTRTDRTFVLPFISHAVTSASYDDLVLLTNILNQMEWYPTGNEATILYLVGSHDTDGIKNAGAAATLPLIHLMGRSVSHPELIRMAGLTGDPRVVPLLIEALTDSSPVISTEAEQTLRRMSNTTLHQGFEIFCTGRDGTTAATYLPLITKKGTLSLLLSLISSALIAKMSSSLRQTVAAWLIDQMDSVYYSDLAFIAQILDTLNICPEEHQNEVYYWVGKRDWNRVWELSGNDVTPLTVALRHETRDNCYAIIRVLGHIASSESTDALISCLYYKDPGIRREATHALTRIHDARKICPLVHVLADQDHEVRKEALLAIIRYGQTYGTGEVVSCLISQVRSVYAGNKKPYTPVIRSIIDIDDPDPVRYFLSIFSDTSLSLHDELFDHALIEYKVQICDWLTRIAKDPRYDLQQIQIIYQRLGCRGYQTDSGGQR